MALGSTSAQGNDLGSTPGVLKKYSPGLNRDYLLHQLPYVIINKLRHPYKTTEPFNAIITNMIVSAKQSPAYQSMPEYETISKRFEKLQVSFSRGMERMGYDGRRIGSEG